MFTDTIKSKVEGKQRLLPIDLPTSKDCYLLSQKTAVQGRQSITGTSKDASISIQCFDGHLSFAIFVAIVRVYSRVTLVVLATYTLTWHAVSTPTHTLKHRGLLRFFNGHRASNKRDVEFCTNTVDTFALLVAVFSHDFESDLLDTSFRTAQGGE